MGGGGKRENRSPSIKDSIIDQHLSRPDISFRFTINAHGSANAFQDKDTLIYRYVKYHGIYFCLPYPYISLHNAARSPDRPGGQALGGQKYNPEQPHGRLL
jgi:hypothetical protein